MDFTMPKELELVVQGVRDFVRQRLAPITEQVEENDDITAEIVAEIAEMGLFGLPFPEKYGGAGLGELGYAMILEELGAVNAAFGNLIGAHTGIGSMSIYLGGAEEQKTRYLPPLCAGEKIAAFALTEPQAGSDAAAIRTTAVRKGEHYVLNGSKIWITNGPIADVVIVYAVTDKNLGVKGGVTGFIVEKGFPGFSVGKIDRKMGLRGSHTAELVFQDCEVPEENVLGQVGMGFLTAMSALDAGRIGLAAGAVGGAQKMMEASIEWANTRVQFGKPIGEQQAIQWMLAEMATMIHAARLMTYEAAWKLDHGMKVWREAAMVKLFASETACKIADMTVQIHGGMGYMKEMPIERMYRDSRILKIYEGTNEIQKLIIARDLLKTGK